MTKIQKDIIKLKKLAENEIIQWLTFLSELEEYEHIEKTTNKIKAAFKK